MVNSISSYNGRLSGWAGSVIRPLIYRAVCIAVVVAFLTASCDSRYQMNQKIAERVQWQMRHYPESRLVDIYKNFFHDKFGPGHLITDSAAVGEYIRRELLVVRGPSQVSYAEVTGWEGNFIRLDLIVLKEGLVSYSQFLEAFMESARDVELPSVEQWRLEWKHIERIVRRLYPRMAGLEEDSRFLESLLKDGKYVVHHSDHYTQAYDPHYRLFKRSVYENRLRLE